jgi:glycosyltransferase involved in cell wall biosynthesis
MKLSVVIPVFNEIKFIDKCIKEVLSAKRFDLDLEII